MLANINKLNRSLEGVIAVSSLAQIFGGRSEADEFRLAMSLVLWRRFGPNSRM